MAHLRGQVEGDRQPAGAVRDKLLVALVGLLGGAEAGVLPHRPGPAGVHRRVDAARERVLPRAPSRVSGSKPSSVLGAVQRLERQPGLGEVLVAGAGRAGRGSFACSHARTVRRPVLALHREDSHSPGPRGWLRGVRGSAGDSGDRRGAGRQALARADEVDGMVASVCTPNAAARSEARRAGRGGPRGSFPRAAARVAGAGEGQRRHRRPAHDGRLAGPRRAAEPGGTPPW